MDIINFSHIESSYHKSRACYTMVNTIDVSQSEHPSNACLLNYTNKYKFDV